MQIGKKAFYKCKALQEIDLRNVTDSVSIGESAFQEAKLNHNDYSSSDYSFLWPSTNVSVSFGASAFNQCRFATNKFELPAKTTSIGNNCFQKCNVTENSVDCSLKEVTANGNLTSLTQINNSAFQECTKLNSFCFDKCTSLQKILDNTFRNTGTLGGDIVLPETLTLISRYGFMFSKITSVTFNSDALTFSTSISIFHISSSFSSYFCNR